MNQPLRIAIVGDYNPKFKPHSATDESLRHSAQALSLAVDFAWLPTERFDDEANLKELEKFDGIWCSAGSPYKSMTGALKAVRFARERNWPFFAT